MFASKSPVIVTQNIINSLVGYVGLYFITQAAPDAFSFLAFAMGFAGVISFISDLGYSQAHVKSISEGKEIDVCNGTYFFIKLVLGLIFAALVVGSLFFWTDVLHRGFQDPIEFWVILAIIPYYFFSNLLGFSIAYFSAKLSPARLAVPSIVEAVLRNSIFIILGIVIIYKIPGYSHEYTAIILAAIYSTTYTIYFTLSYLVGRPWKISKPKMYMFKRYSAIAIPLAISASLGTINGNIDKVIIQFYWHAIATGAFFLDQRIIASITTLSGAFTVFFLPLLSRISSTSKREEFSSSVGEFERLMSLFVLPFVIVFVMLPVYIVNLFKGVFVPYSAILPFLAMNVYFAMVISPYTSAIIAKGQTHLIAKISLISVVTNIILNFVLVPQQIFGFSTLSMGPVGAAVSMFIVTLANNVIYRVYLYRTEKVNFNTKLLKHLLPLSVQVVFLITVGILLPLQRIVFLAPVAVASVAIFLGIALLIKEISLEQIITFAKALNPLTFFKRLKEENV